MSIPESQYNIVAELFLSHRHLLGTLNDDQTREWTRLLANTIRQRTRDPRWGRKRTTPTHPVIGKDTVAYRRDGVGPYIFDVLVGSGTADPKPGWRRVPEEESNTQVWTDEGLDPLDEPDPEPPPPPPPFDPALIYAELAALTELVNELFRANADLETRLDALEAQPVPQPHPPVTVDTSRSWGHFHKVTVPMK